MNKYIAEGRIQGCEQILAEDRIQGCRQIRCIGADKGRCPDKATACNIPPFSDLQVDEGPFAA